MQVEWFWIAFPNIWTAGLKEKMSAVDSVETACCQFKWEAVDCAACSLSLSVSKKIGEDTRVRGAEHSTPSRDLSGSETISQYK